MQNIVNTLLEKQIFAKTDEPLSEHCTFKIGGNAKVFIWPKTKKELCTAVELCRGENIRLFFLGKGSNVLFSDDGFDGAVIDFSKMNELCFHGEGKITASAGVSLNALCKLAEENSLAGLEFAFGIPGSVGGSVYMNAGAYGGEMQDVVESVEVLTKDGEIQTLTKEQMAFSYRKSDVQKNGACVLGATFKLEKGEKAEITALMQKNMQMRKDKQPLDMPSAGSTFKRPEGAFAGALIDECGFKGFAMKNAGVSDKHCGFVVNLGGATCAEVLALCEHIQKVVKEKTGYTLEREVRVIK